MTPKSTPVNTRKKQPKKASAAQKGIRSYSELSPAEQSKLTRFLLQELVNWLIPRTDQYVGHDSEDLDILCESTGHQAPVIFDLKERYPDKGKIDYTTPLSYTQNIPKTSNTDTLPIPIQPVHYWLKISPAIPYEILKRGFLGGEDSNNLSHFHFYPLQLILTAIQEQFQMFVEVLNKTEAAQYPDDYNRENYHRRSVINLKKILKNIRAEKQGISGLRIPDLFSRQAESATPSSDRQIVLTQGKDRDKLWTYMYSRNTSAAFGKLLAEIIEVKIKEARFELGEITSDEIGETYPSDMEIKQWLLKMPKTSTKDRMQIASEIMRNFKSDTSEENKVSWDVGELLIIFLALERSSVTFDFTTTRKALAYSLLTGKSELTFLNLASASSSTATQINYDKILGTKSLAAKKSSTKLLAKKLIAALEAVIREMS